MKLDMQSKLNPSNENFKKVTKEARSWAKKPSTSPSQSKSLEGDRTRFEDGLTRITLKNVTW